MAIESTPLALVGEEPSVQVEPASPTLVRLGAERASLFACVARSMLAELGAGGDVHPSHEGLVLSGPSGDAGARVAVATAIEGVAADLERIRGNGQPATLQLSPRPVPIEAGESLVLHGLIRHGSARGVDRCLDLVERFVGDVLCGAADAALLRGPLFARFDVDGERFLAVLALVDDRAVVRRLGGDSGFLDALREAAYHAFARLWTHPVGIAFCDEGAGGGSMGVAALPLLGAAGEDTQAYGAHLLRMLGPSVPVAFGTMNQTYARTFPEEGALRAVCPDFAARGDVLNLQLFCLPERHYDCTRAALLVQLVQGCLGLLTASGATDGRLLCVDAWAVAEHPDLAPCIAPCCDEECLWAFAAFVDEPPSEARVGPDASDAVAQTVRSVELALSRIERARWWSAQDCCFQPLPRVCVATEPSTGRRFYAACAVLDSVEVCRRWADPEVLRRAIEDETNAAAAHGIH